MQTKTCVWCEKPGTLVLNNTQMGEYREWLTTNKQRFIQDALPSWTDDMREQYMTGTHPECWERNVERGEGP